MSPSKGPFIGRGRCRPFSQRPGNNNQQGCRRLFLHPQPQPPPSNLLPRGRGRGLSARKRHEEDQAPAPAPGRKGAATEDENTAYVKRMTESIKCIEERRKMAKLTVEIQRNVEIEARKMQTMKWIKDTMEAQRQVKEEETEKLAATKQPNVKSEKGKIDNTMKEGTPKRVGKDDQSPKAETAQIETQKIETAKGKSDKPTPLPLTPLVNNSNRVVSQTRPANINNSLAENSSRFKWVAPGIKTNKEPLSKTPLPMKQQQNQPPLSKLVKPVNNSSFANEEKMKFGTSHPYYDVKRPFNGTRTNNSGDQEEKKQNKGEDCVAAKDSKKSSHTETTTEQMSGIKNPAGVDSGIDIENHGHGTKGGHSNNNNNNKDATKNTTKPENFYSKQQEEKKTLSSSKEKKSPKDSSTNNTKTCDSRKTSKRQSRRRSNASEIEGESNESRRNSDEDSYYSEGSYYSEDDDSYYSTEGSYYSEKDDESYYSGKNGNGEGEGSYYSEEEEESYSSRTQYTEESYTGSDGSWTTDYSTSPEPVKTKLSEHETSSSKPSKATVKNSNVVEVRKQKSEPQVTKNDEDTAATTNKSKNKTNTSQCAKEYKNLPPPNTSTKAPEKIDVKTATKTDASTKAAATKKADTKPTSQPTSPALDNRGRQNQRLYRETYHDDDRGGSRFQERKNFKVQKTKTLYNWKTNRIDVIARGGGGKGCKGGAKKTVETYNEAFPQLGAVNTPTTSLPDSSKDRKEKPTPTTAAGGGTLWKKNAANKEVTYSKAAASLAAAGLAVKSQKQPTPTKKSSSPQKAEKKKAATKSTTNTTSKSSLKTTTKKNLQDISSKSKANILKKQHAVDSEEMTCSYEDIAAKCKISSLPRVLEATVDSDVTRIDKDNTDKVTRIKNSPKTKKTRETSPTKDDEVAVDSSTESDSERNQRHEVTSTTSTTTATAADDDDDGDGDGDDDNEGTEEKELHFPDEDDLARIMQCCKDSEQDKIRENGMDMFQLLKNMEESHQNASRLIYGKNCNEDFLLQYTSMCKTPESFISDIQNDKYTLFTNQWTPTQEDILFWRIWSLADGNDFGFPIINITKRPNSLNAHCLSCKMVKMSCSFDKNESCVFGVCC